MSLITYSLPHSLRDKVWSESMLKKAQLVFDGGATEFTLLRSSQTCRSLAMRLGDLNAVDTVNRRKGLVLQHSKGGLATFVRISRNDSLRITGLDDPN